MNDIDQQWAWSQVEAMADGSLPREDRRRMRAAMASDRRLHDAVERAIGLRRGLHDLGRAQVPLALRRRLLEIPSRERGRLPKQRAALWLPAAGAAAVVAVAAAVIVATRPEPVPRDQQVAALRELQTAMFYLNRSTAVAREEVTQAVQNGLREALEASRDALRDTEPQGENGD